MIFNKHAKAVQERKAAISAMVLEQSDTHGQKKKISLALNITPCAKINSKWIVDLNVKHKTEKLLEEDIGEDLQDRRQGKEFRDLVPEA